MINRRYIFILLMAVSIITSCEQINILNYLDINKENKDDKIDENKYFDVNTFVNQSIEKLGKRNVIITKVMSFDDKIDSLKTSYPELKKGLSFLENLELNVKKYIGKFNVVKESLKSGKKVWVYKQDKNEKLVEPLYQLNIEFFDRELEVSKISAHLFFVNILYAKKEIIEMYFDKGGILKSYHINGGSKMIGQDTTRYEVNVKLKIENEL